MLSGWLPAGRPVYSVIGPLGLASEIWAMRSPPDSVNHKDLPSGPTVIPCGALPPVMPVLYSAIIVPVVAIRPILLPLASVNQSVPSGPAMIE
jgi:hypothetical protein